MNTKPETLRRLLDQRQALLDALREILPLASDALMRPELDTRILDARAAIKAAEEQA